MKGGVCPRCGEALKMRQLFKCSSANFDIQCSRCGCHLRLRNDLGTQLVSWAWFVFTFLFFALGATLALIDLLLCSALVGGFAIICRIVFGPLLHLFLPREVAGEPDESVAE